MYLSWNLVAVLCWWAMLITEFDGVIFGQFRNRGAAIRLNNRTNREGFDFVCIWLSNCRALLNSLERLLEVNKKQFLDSEAGDSDCNDSFVDLLFMSDGHVSI